MKRRSFIAALAAIAALPLACLGKPTEELRHIYRLDSNGCNPKRIRLYDLKPGELFIAAEPSSKWTSGVLKCLEAPRQIENGTWSVVCQ